MKRITQFCKPGALALLLLVACSPYPNGGPSAAFESLKLEYESYKLGNGMEVILHVDRSDPIVAVSILYHVGSGREKPGRTGFAHLFEHILFGGSENVPEGMFDRNITTAGGALNGGTDDDFTVYFEVVPKNALEMVLWMESDRFGFILNSLNEEIFLREKEAVLNERRFRYDNVPYGLTNEIISLNLYPENHPYHWQTIGFPEDIKRATLEDAREFFLRWYGPNNATLVIAGDIDAARTKAMVADYFGPIPAGPETSDPEPQIPTLLNTRRLSFEDNFAKSPELNMVFPTVEGGHRDQYALGVLSSLLADGKKAPLYRVVVEEEQLAPSASIAHSNAEIAGTFTVRIRTFPDKSLSDAEEQIMTAFKRFEQEGFSPQDLGRVKIGIITGTYQGIASVFNKAFQMGFANELYGNPAAIINEIKHYQSVSKADVMRVYNDYIKDKPYILTSFVPQGQLNLAAANSTLFSRAPGEGSNLADVEELPLRVTPTTIDRSVQPPLGPDPPITLPEIWSGELANGLRIYGIEHDELPLVTLSLTLIGGHALDQPDKYGAANLLARLMMEGTKNKTPIELEEAIDNLGASINVAAGRESISVTASSLSSKFEQTFALVKEILLEPRWDEVEFERLQRQTIEGINRSRANPSTVAWNTFSRLTYGEGNPQSIPVSGDRSSVERLTVADLQDYYNSNFSPKVAYFTIAGAVRERRAMQALTTLEGWSGAEVPFPEFPSAPASQSAGLYFVDIPDAPLTEIRIGYLGLPYKHPDYYALNVVNYRLGAVPDSYLEKIIREEKGYTYSARSAFVGRHNPGPFVAFSGVRADATYDAMVTFREILNDYPVTFPEVDLIYTQRAMLRSNARRFETLGALMGTLNNIANYDLPFDYIKAREKTIREMTLEEHHRLAQKYLPTDKMIYLVVGDAKTQLEPLKALGLGDPVLLEIE